MTTSAAPSDSAADNRTPRARAGRVNALRRFRSPDDPELLDAERDLAAEQLAAYVRNVLDAAPPLTDAQRSRVVALLCTPTGGGG